ncbi:hypothetical protein KUCAC02_008032, partial [Chaenocephalus aceratus]
KVPGIIIIPSEWNQRVLLYVNECCSVALVREPYSNTPRGSVDQMEQAGRCAAASQGSEREKGHSAPLPASNPVCPGEIEGSGRPRRTRGATNTITSLSQTLNGALRLFNKAKR